MEGSKAHTAKALALALAWVARQQRRWAGLIAYSGKSGERLLALPPLALLFTTAAFFLDRLLLGREHPPGFPGVPSRWPQIGVGRLAEATWVHENPAGGPVTAR